MWFCWMNESIVMKLATVTVSPSSVLPFIEEMPFAKETTTSPPALRIALIRLTIAEPVSEPDPSQAGVQPPLPIGATTMAVPLATSAGHTLIAPSLGAVIIHCRDEFCPVGDG